MEQGVRSPPPTEPIPPCPVHFCGPVPMLSKQCHKIKYGGCIPITNYILIFKNEESEDVVMRSSSLIYQITLWHTSQMWVMMCWAGLEALSPFKPGQSPALTRAPSGLKPGLPHMVVWHLCPLLERFKIIVFLPGNVNIIISVIFINLILLPSHNIFRVRCIVPQLFLVFGPVHRI